MSMTKRLKKASSDYPNYNTLRFYLEELAQKVHDVSLLLTGKKMERLANDFHEDLGKDYYDENNEMILDTVYSCSNKLNEVSKKLNYIAEDVSELARVR